MDPPETKHCPSRLFAIVPVGRRGGGHQLAWGQVGSRACILLPLLLDVPVLVENHVLHPKQGSHSMRVFTNS